MHTNLRRVAIVGILVLWAGVPVLTCTGQSFASRVAARMLTVAGLPALIAPDLAAYEGLARVLARDPERLGTLRQNVAAARTQSPLFDMKLLTRGLEQAYRQMAERYAQGQKPAGFSVKMGGDIPA